MEIRIERFRPELRSDFFRLHSEENGAGLCFCSAWWVPTWDGWDERSAQENRAFREELLARGEYDGYLIYADGEPAGWCQAGPRDRLKKLAGQFGLEPDPDAWALTCFFIAPLYRRKGLARLVLARMLDDIRARGVRRVEAFPRKGLELEVEDLWNGPLSMFLAAGFQVVKEEKRRLVMRLELGG